MAITIIGRCPSVQSIGSGRRRLTITIVPTPDRVELLCAAIGLRVIDQSLPREITALPDAIRLLDVLNQPKQIAQSDTIKEI